MRRPSIVHVAVAIAVATGVAVVPPSESRAAPPRTAPLTDAQCIACHADAARTWRASLHHASASNAAYERAVFAEPLPFCRRCHAPLGDPARETDAHAREAGIGCTTCHLRPDGAVLASPRATSGPAPHGLERTSALVEAACVRCHEFDFPDAAGERMQKTGSEHRASSFAAVSCAECHMPPEGGHRSHAFSASRDAAFLSRAVSIVAERERDRVRFVVEPRNVGHALPTGDLFRRLALIVEPVGDDGHPLAPATGGAPVRRRYFARVFGPVRRGAEVVRRELRDERIFTRTEVAVELDPKAARSLVRWRLVYERVAFSPTRNPEHAVVEESIELARGTLAPPS